MKPFFITSTGTGIGKTLITCSLSYQLRQQGKTVTALKPVMAGYSPLDLDNDSGLILKACGITPTAPLMETISPWRYSQPLAPNMAAQTEGNPVNLDSLVKFCNDHAALESDVLLVEGCGGIMVPLNDHYTVLDWMEKLGWPVILVIGSYLGAISHTLTAVETLKSRALRLSSIIICESDYMAVDLVQTADTLEKFLPDSIPLLKIPRIADKEDIWKQTPPIGWLCQ